LTGLGIGVAGFGDDLLKVTVGKGKSVAFAVKIIEVYS